MEKFCVKMLWQILFVALLAECRVVITNPKSLARSHKRSSDLVENDEEGVRSNELNDGYDEYPIVTPKRAAMLLDRIMVALHHALEDTEGGSRKINDVYRDGSYYAGRQKSPSSKASSNTQKPMVHYKTKDEDDELEIPEILDERSLLGVSDLDQSGDETMDLQRRGHDGSAGGSAGSLGPNKGRVYWRCYFNAVTCF